MGTLYHKIYEFPLKLLLITLDISKLLDVGTKMPSLNCMTN